MAPGATAAPPEFLALPAPVAPAPNADAAAAVAALATPTPFGQPLPDPLLPVEPFDMDLIPSKLRPWVHDTAERMQNPPEFTAIAALAALGTILGSRFGIRARKNDEWTVYANVFALAIGESGIMKSDPMEKMLGPVYRADDVAGEQHEEAMRRYEAIKEIAETRLAKAKSKAKEKVRKDDDYIGPELRAPTPEDFQVQIDQIVDASKELKATKPIQRQYFVNDATPQALMEMLRENPDGLLIFRDEIEGLFQNFERQDMAELRHIILEAFKGDGRYKLTRITRGTLRVSGMCLSLLGSTQPGVIAKYVRQAISGGSGADGFLQRLQITVWPDMPKKWRRVDHERDPAIVEQAYDLFDRLKKLTPEACGAQQDTPKGKPHKRPYLVFSPEAQAVFDTWHEQLENRLRNPDPEEPRALHQHWSKYRSLIPKIALILHLAEEQKGPIGEEVLRKALRWEEFLASHARRVYASGPTAEIDTAHVILAKLASGKLKSGFPAHRVYKSGWAGADNQHIVKDALELLVERGRLSHVPVQAVKGGARSDLYFVRTE